VWRTRRFIAATPVGFGARARRLRRAGGRAGLGGSLDLLVDLRPRAFCYGLCRPRVAVTTGLLALLDEEEIEAVLRHEAYHAAHRDPLRLVAANVLAAIFFFLPLLALLRDHYAVAAELAADRHAVRGMGTDRSIAAALYKLLLRSELPPPPQARSARRPRSPYGSMRCSTRRSRCAHVSDLACSSGRSWAAAALALLLVIPLSLFASNGLLSQTHLAAILC